MFWNGPHYRALFVVVGEIFSSSKEMIFLAGIFRRFIFGLLSPKLSRFFPRAQPFPQSL